MIKKKPIQSLFKVGDVVRLIPAYLDMKYMQANVASDQPFIVTDVYSYVGMHIKTFDGIEVRHRAQACFKVDRFLTEVHRHKERKELDVNDNEHRHDS